MTITVTHAPADKPNPRYASGCRGCGATFEFDEDDAQRDRDGQNHRLSITCPGCNATLVWTLPPHPLHAAVPPAAATGVRP